MKRVQVRSLFLLVLWLFFFCAQRDNRYDPLSPLYHVFPPELKIDFSFDSSRVISTSEDVVNAHPPFNLQIAAQARGGVDGSETLSVYLKYFVNDSLIAQTLNISDIHMELRDTGRHTFQFETSSSGGKTALKTFTVSLSPVSPPFIKSFTCSNDSLSLGRDHRVVFYAEIVDSNRIAKALYYTFSSLNNEVHAVTNHDSIIFHDSLVYTMNSPHNAVQTVTLYVIDILNRKDSLSLHLVFDENHRSMYGKPPRIIDIWAAPDTAEVGQLVDFGIHADDHDGQITGYKWEFGDNYLSNTREPSHRYMDEGLYTAKVSVTDDSGNVAVDSIRIVITRSINQPPVIHSLSVVPDSGYAPLGVSFYADVSDSDGQIVKFIWSMGDMFETWTKTPQFAYTYYHPGTYTVRLIVRDNDWQQDTIFNTVRVARNLTKPPEIKAFPNPAYCNRDIRIIFYRGNLDLDDSATISYTWYLPDNTFVTFFPEIHYMFYAPGFYPIKMTLHDGTTSRDFELILRVL